MGKTSNNQQGVKVSSRSGNERGARRGKVSAALGTAQDVKNCLKRRQATRFRTFPGDSLKELQNHVHEEMIKPRSNGGVSSINGERFEEFISMALRHGEWIEGSGKWDTAWARGPGSTLDSLSEVKSAQNLNKVTPINLRSISTTDIFNSAAGENADNVDPAEVGRRIMAFEQQTMAWNLQSIIDSDERFAGLEDAHSELLIAYGESPELLRITIEPYMPSAEVADQFVWLRDPTKKTGNFMAVLQEDYDQLHDNDVDELKERRVLEWQIGRSGGNLRYLPYNLPGRERLENYTISMPLQAAPSLKHYYYYRSNHGLGQLMTDMKLDKVIDPNNPESRVLGTRVKPKKSYQQALGKKKPLTGKSPALANKNS